MLVETQSLARYIEIQNPFDLNSRVLKDIIVDGRTTIADVAPTMFTEYVVSISGRIVERADWPTTVIKKNECVVFVPVPRGGGGSKNVLRLVAMIAVAIAAPQLAVGMLGAGASATAIGVMSGFIAVAGSLLVNAIIPIEPVAPPVAESLESSPTYGIDGVKNTVQEGVVVPVVYGEYIQGGNLIDYFTENSDTGDQDIYLRFVLSEGEIDHVAVDSIKINDQPKSNFRNVETWWSLGDAAGTVYSDNGDESHPFGGAMTFVPVGVRLDDTMQQRDTSIEVDAIRIDILAPSGFRYIKDDGGSTPLVQELEIEYRSFTSRDALGPWIPLTVYSEEGDTSQTVYVYTHTQYGKKLGTPIYSSSSLYTHTVGSRSSTGRDKSGYSNSPDFVENNVIKVRYQKYDDNGSVVSSSIKVVGYLLTSTTKTALPTFFGRFATPRRISYRSGALPEDFYEVRIRRTTPEHIGSDRYLDRLDWVDLVEIVHEPVLLKHTAWLGVKIRLDNQLNSLPSVNVRLGGRVVKAWERHPDTGELESYMALSRNPAWIAYDMLTHPRVGYGNPESQIDIEAWINWAQHCDENNLTFDGVFDQSMGFWDALLYVMRCGRARPVNIGTRYSVVVERQATPVAMFSVANMVEDSFSINWTPLADRANDLELTYFDINDDYKPNIIRVTNANVPGTTDKRRAELKLFGVTTAEQAVAEGQLQLNLNKYVQQIVNFKVPTEAIAVMVGDVILVQHDAPQWGFGGRCGANSSVTIVNLDQIIPYDPLKSYELLVHFNSVIRGVFSVQSVISNRYVRLSPASIPTEKITRATINGAEYKIIDRFYDSLGEGILVDSNVPPSAVGQPCIIHDTDVVEKRNVIYVGTINDAYTQIEVDEPFSASPTTYTKWLFGEINISSKPFRVSAISGDSNTVRTITATEYHDQIYTLGESLPPPNYSALTPHVAHVVDLRFHQDGSIKSGIYRPIIFISWDIPNDARYTGAKMMYRYKGEGAWTALQDFSIGQTDYEYHGAQLGDELEFTVIADGVLGYAPQKTAPIISVVATNPPPPDVDTLFIANGKLTWTYPSRPLDHAGFEIRYHGSNRDTWADATPLHQGILTSSPFDVSDQAIGSVTFLIKAIDTSGKYSVNPTMVLANLGNGALENALLTLGMHETPTQWALIETITSGFKNGANEIEATEASTFYNPNGGLPFYGQDNDLFYRTQYDPVVYQITVNVDPQDIGSGLIFEHETNGFSSTVEFKPASGSAFSPFAGRISSLDESQYFIRITIPSFYGVPAPRITDARYSIDVSDVTEEMQDVTIGVGGTRLSLTKEYRAIKFVSLTIQADGSGVTTLKVMDKDHVLGPLIMAYNINTPVSATIDAHIRGY